MTFLSKCYVATFITNRDSTSFGPYTSASLAFFTIIVICLFYIHDEKNLSNSILVKVLAGPSGREHSWGLRETMSSYVFMFGGLEAASIIGIFVTESN